MFSPARWTTASTPASALDVDAARRRDPSATSPGSSAREPGRGRTSRRTRWPPLVRNAHSACPTKPEAPVTATVSGAGPAAVARAWRTRSRRSCRWRKASWRSKPLARVTQHVAQHAPGDTRPDPAAGRRPAPAALTSRAIAPDELVALAAVAGDPRAAPGARRRRPGRTRRPDRRQGTGSVGVDGRAGAAGSLHPHDRRGLGQAAGRYAPAARRGRWRTAAAAAG